MGWFIACTILGIMSGFFFMPVVGNGVNLAQDLDVFVFVLCGTILGVGTGLANDLSLTSNSPDEPKSMETESPNLE